MPEETVQTNSLVEQLICSGPIKPRVDPQPVGSMPGASKLEIGLDYADIPKVTQSLVERLKENIDE